MKIALFALFCAAVLVFSEASYVNVRPVSVYHQPDPPAPPIRGTFLCDCGVTYPDDAFPEPSYKSGYGGHSYYPPQAVKSNAECNCDIEDLVYPPEPPKYG